MRNRTALILCLLLVALLIPRVSFAFSGYVLSEPDLACKYDCASFGLKTGKMYYADGGSDLYVDIIPQPARYNRPHQFIVVQYETKLKTFSTLNAAIQYAKQWHAARVFEDVTCELRWDNRPAMVYQTNHLLKSFSSTTEAIQYAKRWDHARVVDKESKAIVWHNYPNLVYQDDHLLKSFSTMKEAVTYASKWSDSYIVDGFSNEVIWVLQAPHTRPVNFLNH